MNHNEPSMINEISIIGTGSRWGKGNVALDIRGYALLSVKLLQRQAIAVPVVLVQKVGTLRVKSLLAAFLPGCTTLAAAPIVPFTHPPVMVLAVLLVLVVAVVAWLVRRLPIGRRTASPGLPGPTDRRSTTAHRRRPASQAVAAQEEVARTAAASVAPCVVVLVVVVVVAVGGLTRCRRCRSSCRRRGRRERCSKNVGRDLGVCVDAGLVVVVCTGCIPTAIFTASCPFTAG